MVEGRWVHDNLPVPANGGGWAAQQCAQPRFKQAVADGLLLQAETIAAAGVTGEPVASSWWWHARSPVDAQLGC